MFKRKPVDKTKCVHKIESLSGKLRCVNPDRTGLEIDDHACLNCLSYEIGQKAPMLFGKAKNN